MTRRRRPLGAEERALWEHVVRSVAPLRPSRTLAMPSAPPAPEPLLDAPAAEPAVPKVKSKATNATPKKAFAPAQPAPPPLSRIEPKVRRKLNRGADVDARLDLHGLTQAAAHRRLHLFVADAQAAGFSLVLVITGKGGGEEAFGIGGGRGILRRAVPQWLGDHALRPYVVGFENAARHHGGEGALYVRIRRRRAGSSA
ncbi:Smr/MutS family protein [Xanthobacteraceae bacterium A53D]